MSATFTVYSSSSRPSCAAAAGAMRTVRHHARHQIRVRRPVERHTLEGTMRMGVLLVRSLSRHWRLQPWWRRADALNSGFDLTDVNHGAVKGGNTLRSVYSALCTSSTTCCTALITDSGASNWIPCPLCGTTTCRPRVDNVASSR